MQGDKEINLIYFIQQGNNGNIKIGYSKNPKKRLIQLQTATISKLYIIGKISGNRQNEKEIHQYLFKHRLRGEWFKPVKEVLNIIKKKKMPPRLVWLENWLRLKNGDYYTEGYEDGFYYEGGEGMIFEVKNNLAVFTGKFWF